MAYSKKYIESVEQSILDSCKTDVVLEERDVDDSHLQKKKRDKFTPRISNAEVSESDRNAP